MASRLGEVCGLLKSCVGGGGSYFSLCVVLHGLHEMYSIICDLNRISESFV